MSIIKTTASRWHRRNPSVDQRDLEQECWLMLLERPELHAGLACKKACARLVAESRTQLSVPWQYLYHQPHAASRLAQEAFHGVSLDSPMPGQDDASWGDLVPANGKSADWLVSAKQRFDQACAGSTPAQRYMLQGLARGLSLADVARSRGVSRAKTSLEYKAVLRKLEDT